LLFTITKFIFVHFFLEHKIAIGFRLEACRSNGKVISSQTIVVVACYSAMILSQQLIIFNELRL
jgi:hypothetical protein